MAYNPNSNILFVTLGSMHQLSGGMNEYNEQDSITSRLPIRRLKREGKIQFDEAEAMLTITKTRNAVVYEEYQISRREWDRVEIAWRRLVDGVKKRGWRLSEF